MPKPLFSQLAPSKQEKIYQALLQEFATHPYAEASTNRIAKQAGIAKGSLFNYFEDKEDLYLYTLITTHMDLVAPLREQAAPFFKEKDLLLCFQGWAAAQLRVLQEAPLSYDLFMYFKQAPLHLRQRYTHENASTFARLQQECFVQIDRFPLRQDLSASIRLLMWGYQGIQSEMALFSAPVSRLSAQERDAFEASFLEQLKQLCESMRHGLYVSNRERSLKA